MSNFDFDLFVIGAGSGGVRASRMAAQKGVKVAIAEDLYLGGTCVNVGCVPKKLYVYGSHIKEELEGAAGYGWTVDDYSFDWPTLRDNKSKEISRLNGAYSSLLSNAGVELFDGRARIVDAHTLAIGEKTYSAERILIATGGWPVTPSIPGSEHMITSNEVFDLDVLPKKALVIGGGYIAVEFAGIFNGLGVDTKLIYRGPMFLRGFDNEVREFVRNEIAQKGVNLAFDTNITKLEKLADNEYEVTYTDGTTEVFNCVLSATGRKANVDSLGLENTKVKLNERGEIVVNDQFQTTDPSIYALGDVTGGMALTPVALAEGMSLVKQLYEGQTSTLNYDNIATAVFSQPNIATVGISEEQAVAKGIALDVFTSNFKHMKHSLSGINERTFMKLIVDRSTDRIIGFHIVGSDAGEIIQGIAIAMNANVTKEQFDQTIGIHPTAAEEFVTMREVTRQIG